ncbi:MAG: M61 family metallopeptidase [Oxalobacter sp.]|nr:M61 family metallopeptidase [Oxalobacter sp.]
MTPSIHYAIEPIDPNGHLFHVDLTVTEPAPGGQGFSLPTWIPGSYMVREFSRNIIQMEAVCNGVPVPLTKLDKNHWQAASCNGPLTVSYDVYAWDLSVRTAHLDQTHGFFNGSSVFLEAQGNETEPLVIDIKRPFGERYDNWRVITALQELAAERYGFGTYQASNYDELIDSPVELGTFVLGQFEAHGTLHEIAVTGHVPNLDMARLEKDLKAICETEIAFFEPGSRRSPVDRYVFLVMAVGNGYGGLEHRASTALLCSRKSLPSTATPEQDGKLSDDYIRFLGLCSHEYFHTWNVKRIKPAAFIPYQLDAETDTRMLWLFEGFTSYFDDLVLLRSRLIDVSTYLQLVAKTINSVMRGKGYLRQSISDAGFDAWTKYYRQDENSPNALVSYYTKGSLVALLLDLTIREATSNHQSLDDVMRLLWQRFGKPFDKGLPAGMTDADAKQALETISGTDLSDFFNRYIYGTTVLPLTEAFARFGITMKNSADAGKPSLNVRVRPQGNDCVVSHVYENGTAHYAGVAAGDVLLAIDGIRVSADGKSIAGQLSRYALGDSVNLHVFRRDELMRLPAILVSEEAPEYTLTLAENAADAMKTARQSWLGS